MPGRGRPVDKRLKLERYKVILPSLTQVSSFTPFLTPHDFMVMILMSFPAFQGFIMKMAWVEDAGEYSVAGRKEICGCQKHGKKENDAGAGGNIGKEREEESADRSCQSEQGSTPEHPREGVCKKIGRGSGQNQ